MPRTVRSIVLGSLVIAMLACGTPARTVVPGASTPQSASTATAVPPQPPAISISEAVTAGIDSGRWNEAEGILAALRYLAGEISEQEAFGDVAPASVEGTGVVRRAQAYLADPSNGDGREDMTRLLLMLVPPRQILERISEPEPAASSFASGLARPPRRPFAQAETPCRLLWSSGFAEPGICLRYHQTVIGGRTHRVYAPIEWHAEGDPHRELIDAAQTALEDSLARYNTYGPDPVMSIDIVFTDLPFLDRTVRRSSVLAVASDDVSDGRCHVGVFPAAGSAGLASIKQTIAHELFHCYQYTNVPGKVLPIPEEVNGWWVEGTAEFFGSIVYPNGNDEWRYAPLFDDRSTYSPMHQLSYDAYLLFQFLAVQQGGGAEGVIEIIRQMPDGGGSAEQRDALAGIGGVDEAFHEFGRAYLDRKLVDPGGGFTPVNPLPGETFSFHVGENRQHLDSDGFWLDRYRLGFDDRARFENRTEEGEGEGRLSARLSASPGSWDQIPSTVNTACGEGDFTLLVTSTAPTDGTPRPFDISSTGEDAREELECDECVVGTWVLENGSYLSHMGGVWSLIVGLMPSYGLSTEGATAFPTDVFGQMTIKFNGDGTVSGGQEGWGIAGMAIKDDDVVTASMTYGGVGEAAWRIEEDEEAGRRYLFFDEGEFSLSGQMTFQGFPLRPIAFSESNDPVFLSTPQPFACTDTTLTYYVDDPLGPVVFQRGAVEEETP